MFAWPVVSFTLITFVAFVVSSSPTRNYGHKVKNARSTFWTWTMDRWNSMDKQLLLHTSIDWISRLLPKQWGQRKTQTYDQLEYVYDQNCDNYRIGDSWLGEAVCFLIEPYYDTWDDAWKLWVSHPHLASDF